MFFLQMCPNLYACLQNSPVKHYFHSDLALRQVENDYPQRAISILVKTECPGVFSLTGNFTWVPMSSEGTMVEFR